MGGGDRRGRGEEGWGADQKSGGEQAILGSRS